MARGSLHGREEPSYMQQTVESVKTKCTITNLWQKWSALSGFVAKRAADRVEQLEGDVT